MSVTHDHTEPVPLSDFPPALPNLALCVLFFFFYLNATWIVTNWKDFTLQNGITNVKMTGHLENRSKCLSGFLQPFIIIKGGALNAGRS